MHMDVTKMAKTAQAPTPGLSPPMSFSERLQRLEQLRQGTVAQTDLLRHGAAQGGGRVGGAGGALGGAAAGGGIMAKLTPMLARLLSMKKMSLPGLAGG